MVSNMVSDIDHFVLFSDFLGSSR